MKHLDHLGVWHFLILSSLSSNIFCINELKPKEYEQFCGFWYWPGIEQFIEITEITVTSVEISSENQNLFEYILAGTVMVKFLKRDFKMVTIYYFRAMLNLLAQWQTLSAIKSIYLLKETNLKWYDCFACLHLIKYVQPNRPNWVLLLNERY